MNNLQPLPDDNPSDTSRPTIIEDDAKAARQIRETIGNSREILAEATTVFPFTLFPDTAIIDREKLTITHRFFFMVAEVTTIQIEDILNVTADVGPLFGSLQIHSRFFNPDRPQTINYLWRNDATRLKRVLQGYVIATQKKIDCSRFSVKQLTQLLDELGGGDPSGAI